MAVDRLIWKIILDFLVLACVSPKLENGWTDLANIGPELCLEVQGRYKVKTTTIDKEFRIQN
uniref:SFRICE_007607 n=1 Tax=Spodoptera frugiperda TaxID=7108 RepID=A0A2H1W702_SPOFR